MVEVIQRRHHRFILVIHSNKNNYTKQFTGRNKLLLQTGKQSLWQTEYLLSTCRSSIFFKIYQVAAEIGEVQWSLDRMLQR